MLCPTASCEAVALREATRGALLKETVICAAPCPSLERTSRSTEALEERPPESVTVTVTVACQEWRAPSTRWRPRWPRRTNPWKRTKRRRGLFRMKPMGRDLQGDGAAHGHGGGGGHQRVNHRGLIQRGLGRVERLKGEGHEGGLAGGDGNTRGGALERAGGPRHRRPPRETSAGHPRGGCRGVLPRRPEEEARSTEAAGRSAALAVTETREMEAASERGRRTAS